MTKEDSYELFT